MSEVVANWNAFETVCFGPSLFTIERRTLVQLVFEAADSVDWPKTAGTVPSPVLRSVILYALALNVCSSEEIVEASEIDPTMRYLCANHSLDWEAVHDFRKRHLGVIHEALSRFFSSLSAGGESPELRREAGLEADARVHRAVQGDSMVLDL